MLNSSTKVNSAGVDAACSLLLHQPLGARLQQCEPLNYQFIRIKSLLCILAWNNNKKPTRTKVFTNVWWSELNLEAPWYINVKILSSPAQICFIIQKWQFSATQHEVKWISTDGPIKPTAAWNIYSVWLKLCCSTAKWISIRLGRLSCDWCWSQAVANVASGHRVIST